MTAPRISADWLQRPATQRVFAALAAAGHEARVVGGAVRNTLLGRLITDIDFATTARPEAVVAAAEAAGLGVVPTGLAHGTVTVLVDHVPFEVTTLRRDVETDGRRAVVAFTDDWAGDAARRDFTLNALYCDAAGHVFDPLGGYADLSARRVRFIGDAAARIREDYLRILRFFRFSAAYAAGPLDPVGLTACGRLRAGLAALSAERVRVEILKLLVAPRAADVVGLMHAHGYWPALIGLAAVPAHLEALLAGPAPAGSSADGILQLAALAVAVPEDAVRVAARLRLSAAERRRLTAVGRLWRKLAPDMDRRALRRLTYAEGVEAVTGAATVAVARHATVWPDEACRRLTADIAAWTPPKLPIAGADVIACGIPPGPAVGALLADVEAAWIADDFLGGRADVLRLLEGLVDSRRPAD